MRLSPGSCLQAQGPSVTWTAVEFASKSSGHYSLEMGRLAGCVAVGQKSREADSAPCDLSLASTAAAGTIGTEVAMDLDNEEFS